MRRIVYTVVRFPSVLEFDPYLRFPEGGEAIWTPLFDGTVAFLLRPFANGDDAAAVERVAVWIPPLLGAATVLALHRLALRHLGARVAWVSALLLTVLSAHFWYSQIGFLDHHAAVALVSTLVLASGMELLRRFGEEPALRWETWRAAVGAGIWLALALLLWTGSLIHVGLVQLGLSTAMLARGDRGEAVRLAVLIAAAQGTALLCVLPFAWGEVGINPVVVSWFQPAVFGVGALFAAGCALLWSGTALGATRSRRIAGIAGVAGVLALAALAAVPELARGPRAAWAWFFAESGFQSQVGESQPLLLPNGRLEFADAELRLSRFVYLLPLAWAWALASTRSHHSRAPLLLFLGWTGALFVATLVQLRFMNSFSVSMALLMGWTFVRVHDFARERLARSRRRRLALGGAWLLVLAVILQPMLPAYARHFRNQLEFFREGPVYMAPSSLRRRWLAQLGDWMRHHTPPTRGFLDASERPEYGILAAWSLGHALRYTARRPVVRDNFGNHFGVGIQYFASDEERGSATLDRLETRYVVVSPHVEAELPEIPPHSMYQRLYLHDGSEKARGPQGGNLVAALERHRLVFEIGRTPRPGRPDEPLFKVFEYVPGALLTGRSPPGAWIEARLPLRTNQGRYLVYRATVRADDAGRYAIRLPYANRGGPPATRTHVYYTLYCHAGSARAVIEEEHVRRGAEVPGPDLCL